MVEKILKVTPKLGFHARVAGLFVQEASLFSSSIKVSKESLEVNGKSIMGLMLLAAEMGSLVKIRIEGADEAQAMAALEKLFENKFNEE